MEKGELIMIKEVIDTVVGKEAFDAVMEINDKIDNNLKYSFKRAFCDKDKNGLED